MRGSVQLQNRPRMFWDKLLQSSRFVFHYLKSKVCMRCIVFGSRRSAETISTPGFDSCYWAEPHCSPAFPNLGGIPPPGNMVYKRRTPPHTHPSPSTLQPLGNICSVFLSGSIQSLALTAESPGLSHQGVSQRVVVSILTSRHRETCLVLAWQRRKPKGGGMSVFVWSDESLQYDPSQQ